MNAFEFVLGMYTIVAGLGISLLVRSVGQLINARGRVRTYWAHSLLVASLFAIQFLAWFSLERFSTHSPWTAMQVLLLPVVPVLLYLVGILAVPNAEAGAAVDLREHYYRNARWTYGLLLLATLCWAAAQRYIDAGVGGAEGLFRFALPAVLFPALFTRRPAVHHGIVVLLAVLVIAGAWLMADPLR